MRTKVLLLVGVVAVAMQAFAQTSANKKNFPLSNLASTLGKTESGQTQKHMDQAKKTSQSIENFLQSFLQPIRIQQSERVTVNSAQFVIVAQTDWTPAKQNELATLVVPVEIQLQITNIGKHEMVFPSACAVGIKVSDLQGKEIKKRQLGKNENTMSPILLPPGASYSFCPRVELRSTNKDKEFELVVYDKGGAQTLIGPLQCGRYSVALFYSQSDDKLKQKPIRGALDWIGSVATKEVTITLQNETTRGGVPESAQSTYSSDVIRIRQSKQVVTNEAEFVVTTQVPWNSNELKVVPIDIQLRITNYSKRDIVFPTFDAFGIMMETANGKQVAPRGGRDVTIMTRPILIPHGVSYTIARKGMLAPYSKMKRCEFSYYDGTGRVSIFGPLGTGACKLAFAYRVSPLRGKANVDNARIWSGSAVTDRVIVDVIEP